jgi:hypothetical protein
VLSKSGSEDKGSSLKIGGLLVIPVQGTVVAVPPPISISATSFTDPEITDAQVTSGTGTDEVLPTPAKLKTMIQAHSSGGGGTLPPEITNAQVTSGVGTSTVLMTPSKNKAMIIAHAPSGGGTTLPPEITNSQVNSGVGTTTVLVTPAKNKAMIEAHSTNVELPAQVSTAEKTARTETALRSWSVKDVADMDIGGGTATTVPWAGITSKPPIFKEEPLSSDPDFDNTYKGGISIDTNGGITRSVATNININLPNIYQSIRLLEIPSVI